MFRCDSRSGGSVLRHSKYPNYTNHTPCTSLQHCLSDGACSGLLRYINDTSTILRRYFDDISTIYNGRNMIEVSSINSRYDGVGCLMERRKPLRLSCLISRDKFCGLKKRQPIWLKSFSPAKREIDSRFNSSFNLLFDNQLDSHIKS